MYNGFLRNTFLEKPDYILNILLEPANSFVVAIPYMALGYYMNNNKIGHLSCNIRIVSLIFCIILFFTETYICKSVYHKTDVFISLIPLTALLVYMLTSIDIHLNQTLALFMRKSSILIYLSHAVFIQFLGYLGIACGAMCFMCTLILSIMFSCVIIFGSTKFAVLKKMY